MQSRFARIIGILSLAVISAGVGDRARAATINFGGLVGPGSTAYAGDSGSLTNHSSVGQVFDPTNPAHSLSITHGTLVYETGPLSSAGFTPNPPTGPVSQYFFQA